MSSSGGLDPRWIVEREQGRFEDVGQEHMVVADSGALVFFDADGSVLQPSYVIAPGQWVSVVWDGE